MKRSSSAARDAGFTLMELLVALALIGLVSLLATGLIRFAADGERRLAQRAAEIGDRIAFERRLRREMNAVLPLLDYESGRPESSFAGDSLSFRFIAAAGDGPRRRVLSIAGEGAVELREGRFAEAIARFAPGAQSISYYGLRNGETEPGWHEVWAGELVPPRLIRLEMDEAPGLVVAIPAERADQ
ncbi:MAG: prepilin-type N-terminal cleavage/methylation domain-containing protein [Nisaea sp.]|uniref:prepilin-type N-terminal cleavage/methylation domain-containing protein n=1 Tax=Nisaea sp. TaxID=2024842 RepID=UPI001B15D6D3|nr:prepilin-type N-terminal cleavage/methylation domain-containing protein [Nisaea sp.]MBO6562074.1 prepilin-type N-terminal cleavage/methylation domain-containing protein [Nisaea sp.]